MTLTTTRGGSWVLVAAGIQQYCSLGQHFTTGATWAWYLDDRPLATAHVCDACAREATA